MRYKFTLSARFTHTIEIEASDKNEAEMVLDDKLENEFDAMDWQSDGSMISTDDCKEIPDRS
jgi:hypothetical protein